jgi:hypothetical protein
MSKFDNVVVLDIPLNMYLPLCYRGGVVFMLVVCMSQVLRLLGELKRRYQKWVLENRRVFC